jgi:hypothetical protein
MIDLDSSTLCSVTGGDCFGATIVWGDTIICVGLHVK